MDKWNACLHTRSIYWWCLFASQRTAKSQNNRYRSTENLIIIHEIPYVMVMLFLWCAISAASLGSSFSGTMYTHQYVAKFRHYILKTFQFTCASFPQDIATAHITSDNYTYCLANFFVDRVTIRGLWPHIFPDTNLYHWFLLWDRIIE
jgi:hypothetical protein